jgi:Fe-Mn family superoxide dismutase
MAIEVPPLPYAKTALEPVMKQETFDYHYEKHHKTYATTLNGLIAGKPEESKSLVEIIKSSSGPVFNNAAQVWNHTFFWESMKPNGGGAPPEGPVADLINGLGGYEKFKTDFQAAGVGQFGSGWCWLQVKNGKLEIAKTPNGENPLVHGATPILGCDVWEHSYYIDYRNRRPDYLKAFVENLVNWEYVESLFDKA